MNSRKIKIGVTERGDAGWDLGWADKLDRVDGAIIITKHLTPGCIDKLLSAYDNGHKLILHCGCTGWGGTKIELGAPSYQDTLGRLVNLIDRGFPIGNCVLRIDPIFPTLRGLRRVEAVLAEADRLGLFSHGEAPIRVRISVLDEYRHVKQRFRDLGYGPIYGDTAFYAPKPLMDAASAFLARMGGRYGIRFETCAEPLLQSPRFIRQGCVSAYDLSLMGLGVDTDFVNPQHRTGCLCLGSKTELLSYPRRCPNKCAYCYWKGD